MSLVLPYCCVSCVVFVVCVVLPCLVSMRLSMYLVMMRNKHVIDGQTGFFVYNDWWMPVGGSEKYGVRSKVISDVKQKRALLHTGTTELWSMSTSHFLFLIGPSVLSVLFPIVLVCDSRYRDFAISTDSAMAATAAFSRASLSISSYFRFTAGGDADDYHNHKNNHNTQGNSINTTQHGKTNYRDIIMESQRSYHCFEGGLRRISNLGAGALDQR